MPTYQYACTACEERLEVVQSFTDESLTTCPACGGRLRKVFSAAGIIFKGSGFYRTDSRSGSKAGSNGGKKAESEGSESKSKTSDGTGTDSKSSDSKGSDSKSSDSSSSAGGKSGSTTSSSSSEKVA